jgi:Bacteriophage head to tail connecting protein
MSETVEETRERVAASWSRKQLYNRQLREIYRYFMPYRDTVGMFGLENQTEGANRTDMIFDITGPNAAFRFAGRLQSMLTPVFQQCFSLEAGPMVPEGQQQEVLNLVYQKIGRMVNGILSGGSFAMKAHEMYLDLFAGGGNMFIAEGNHTEPCLFRTVPLPEVAYDLGPYGDIWGVDWRKVYKSKHLPNMWPKGTFSDAVCRKIDEKTADITMHQSTMYDPKDDSYKLRVFCDVQNDNEIIWEEDFGRVSPWITPRFFVVPGEVDGRGLAHLGLPACKTLNKVRELELLAAAFAVLGIWTRRNDGVFNPDMVKFEPLSMWQVGSTGGPLGPTIQRLDTPKDFNVAHIVMDDERMQLKQALFDDQLPPESGAVRSATEIAERMKQLSQDLGGVYGRLTLEIVKPVVMRVIAILEKKHMLPTNIKIDDLATRVRVVAPIAAGQQADKVGNIVNWLQMMSMLAGPQAALMAAKVEALFPEMGRMLGVEERFIRSEQDRSQLMQMIGALQGAGQAAAMKGPDQGAPAPGPAQKIVNGGAH